MSLHLHESNPRVFLWHIAVGYHGTYNAFLAEGGLGWISLLLVLPGMLFVLSMKIHWARAQSGDYHIATAKRKDSI